MGPLAAARGDEQTVSGVAAERVTSLDDEHHAATGADAARGVAAMRILSH